MRSQEWNPKELLKKSLVTNIAPKLLNTLLNLVALSFCNWTSWFIVSNAFQRSISIIPVNVFMLVHKTWVISIQEQIWFYCLKNIMDVNQKQMRSQEWNPEELLKKSLVTNVVLKLLNTLLNLVALSFCNRTSWFIVSNAFRRSISIIPVIKPSSNPFNILSVKCVKHRFVNWSGLIPIRIA